VRLIHGLPDFLTLPYHGLIKNVCDSLEAVLVRVLPGFLCLINRRGLG